VVKHRDAHKGDFEARGAKLTYTGYFVAAAVVALKAVPEANSRWHDDHLEIFDDINIGVATALLALNEVFGPCYDISAAEALAVSALFAGSS